MELRQAELLQVVQALELVGALGQGAIDFLALIEILLKHLPVLFLALSQG